MVHPRGPRGQRFRADRPGQDADVPGPRGLVAAWEPATYDRLLALKSRTDPSNLFRLGHALV